MNAQPLQLWQTRWFLITASIFWLIANAFILGVPSQMGAAVWPQVKLKAGFLQTIYPDSPAREFLREKLFCNFPLVLSLYFLTPLLISPPLYFRHIHPPSVTSLIKIRLEIILSFFSTVYVAVNPVDRHVSIPNLSHRFVGFYCIDLWSYHKFSLFHHVVFRSFEDNIFSTVVFFSPNDFLSEYWRSEFEWRCVPLGTHPSAPASCWCSPHECSRRGSGRRGRPSPSLHEHTRTRSHGPSTAQSYFQHF